jgi:hypothetical protein
MPPAVDQRLGGLFAGVQRVAVDRGGEHALKGVGVDLDGGVVADLVADGEKPSSKMAAAWRR